MIAHDQFAMGLPSDNTTATGPSRPSVRVMAWHIPLLVAILGLSAFLNFYQLDRVGYANAYYAAAVRSMTENWHAFFFNSFDPAGFVTVDKPPLGFWFQVASAKVFGYSALSLLLPQALAGVLSVLVLFHLVRRWFGAAAGLIAALALAVTPVAVVDNRNNIIDSTLTLFLLLSAWAVLYAAETGRLRWLLVGTALVGLGFNVKMLEAYLIVPALGLTYLLAARAPWSKRIVHLLLAAVVLVVVSLSWVLAVDLTPVSERPYVDSTSTNSEIDLALGYNGLQRLLGQNRSGGRGGFTPGGTGARLNTLAVPGIGGTSGSLASGSPAGGAPTSPNPGGSGNGGNGSGANGGFGSGGGAAGGNSGFGSGGSTAGTGNSGFGAGAGGTSSGVNSGIGSSAGIAGGNSGFGGGAARGNRGSGGGGGGGGGGAIFQNGAAGPMRLLDTELGGQAGWLLTFALFGLVAAASRKLRFPLSSEHRALVLWGAWLLTEGGFFSVASFFHSYYMVTMAPSAAALVGIGMVALWREYRTSARWDPRGWLLPIALVVTGAAQSYILRDYPSYSDKLTPLLLAGSIGAAAVLVLARIGVLRFLPRLSLPVVALVGLGALMAAPTTWAAETVNSANSGGVPSAGPSAARGFGGFGGGGQLPPGLASNPQFEQLARRFTDRGGFGGGAVPGGIPVGQGADGVNAALLAYLEKHQGTTTYLFATSNSNSAAPWIIQTGKPVMSLGGFSGSNPILTVADLETLIANNTVHYFMLTGFGGFGGGGDSGQSISSYVQTSCTVVPSTAWQTGSSSAATPTTGGFGGGFGRGGGGQTLYYCGSPAAQSSPSSGN